MHRLGFRYFHWAALAVVAIVLIRDTLYSGNDFQVYYDSVRYLFIGKPIYDVHQEGALVFKYPPWILTMLSPFGIFGQTMSRILFGLMNVMSIAYVLFWLRARGVDSRKMFIVFWMFWGIWAVNALDGQINAMIVAAALWGLGRFENKDYRAAATIITLIALSTKIFSIFGAIWIIWRRKEIQFLKTTLLLSISLVAMTVPIAYFSYQGDGLKMFRQWKEAAMSGGVKFDGEKVRGRDNQGLPAAILRQADVRGENSSYDTGVGLFFALVIGCLSVILRSKRETEPWEEGVSLLAWVPVIHPLSWFHVFVFAFPLCVVVLTKAKRKNELFLAVTAVALVACVTKKTLPGIGSWAEMISVKSIGVVFCQALYHRFSVLSHFTNKTSSSENPLNFSTQEIRKS